MCHLGPSGNVLLHVSLFFVHYMVKVLLAKTINLTILL